MFKSFKPLAIAMLAVAAGAAGATTIGFDKPNKTWPATHYNENGFHVAGETKGGLDTGLGWDGNFLATTGFTFSALSGETFDLNEFTLAFDESKSVTLTYTVDGQAAQTVFLKQAGEGLGTYDFGKNFDDLTSFSVLGWSKKNANGTASQFLIDDIKVSLDRVTPAVPEPGSMALMLAGIAMIGTMARRRRG